MRFQASIIAAALACATPLAAQGAVRDTRWHTVLTSGDNATVAIDSATIDRSGDSTFTVRSAIRFPARVTLPTGERVDREVDTEELDCGGGRSRGLLSEIYAGDTLVKTVPLPKTWAAVPAGRRAVFDASCAWLLGGFALRLGRSYEVSLVDEAPELVNRPAVSTVLSREYPRALREAGQTGTVTLRFRVRENGLVDRPSVEVVDYTHPDFAEAARKVVYAMRFRPARIRRVAVPVWVSIPVNFNIAWDGGTDRTSPGFPPPFPPPPAPRGRP